MTDRPLEGIKVLDFTIAMAGPLAAQRLGDMGAEVIKVEAFTGDLARAFFLQDCRLDDDSTSYLALNRNKKSLAINLKKEEGKQIIYDLVKDMDVFFQNFRPGVVERLGISYEDIIRINPGIVYVSISGYGDEGPLKGVPGQDLLVQSFSGVTYSAGVKDSMPHPGPTYFIDTCASHLATEGILAALFQKQRTGKGQHVKTNLLNAALEAQSQEVMTYMQTHEVARRTRAPFASAWLEPPYGIYKTSDSWLALPQNDMKVIASVVGSDKLMRHLDDRPPKENREEIDEWRAVCYDLLAEALLDKTTDEWVELMTPEKIWCGPVLDIAGMVAHEQSRYHLSSFNHPEHGEIPCVKPGIAFSLMPQPPMSPPPDIGEHTEEILKGLGYSNSRVADLKNAEVVR